MSKTKRLCLNAMGVALFVVLTLCLQVPVFENYYHFAKLQNFIQPLAIPTF